VRYQVYITQKGNLFRAEVPALPGCGTVGRSEDEAVDNIRLIIREHRRSLKRKNQPLPSVLELEMPEEETVAVNGSRNGSANGHRHRRGRRR
jgi:predicted RNase H-like HicB family nuclease